MKWIPGGVWVNREGVSQSSPPPMVPSWWVEMGRRAGVEAVFTNWPEMVASMFACSLQDLQQGRQYKLPCKYYYHIIKESINEHLTQVELRALPLRVQGSLG